MTFEQRQRQRLKLFEVGKISIFFGFGIFFSGGILFFIKPSSLTLIETLLTLGLFLIPLGILLSVFFSQIGWNSKPIVDFFLNQASIIVTILGFMVILFNIAQPEPTRLITGIILLLLGIVIAGFGMKKT